MIKIFIQEVSELSKLIAKLSYPEDMAMIIWFRDGDKIYGTYRWEAKIEQNLQSK
jgi:hypothetical protein